MVFHDLLHKFQEWIPTETVECRGWILLMKENPLMFYKNLLNTNCWKSRPSLLVYKVLEPTVWTSVDSLEHQRTTTWKMRWTALVISLTFFGLFFDWNSINLFSDFHWMLCTDRRYKCREWPPEALHQEIYGWIRRNETKRKESTRNGAGRVHRTTVSCSSRSSSSCTSAAGLRPSTSLRSSASDVSSSACLCSASSLLATPGDSNWRKIASRFGRFNVLFRIDCVQHFQYTMKYSIFMFLVGKIIKLISSETVNRGQKTL